ncbi:MAG: hypothetical protein AB1374_10170 [Bacillota bacterium]
MLHSVKGVINVHDLHIWTITSGLDSLSCHLLASDDAGEHTILQEVIKKIEERFKIRHTTVQIEKSQLRHAESRV